MGAGNDPNSEESFFEWLTGRNISEKENDTLSYENVPLLTLEEAAEETEEGPYIGMEGLQKAVIRFLYEAARTGNGQMFLYSDMKMNWMVSSKTFFRRWYSLMTICANKGIKITIIHNIDRSKSEMTEAVKSWMPLYMTGNIKSFYNTKDNGTRFSNTIFIYKSDRKSGICIKGDSPRGLENHRPQKCKRTEQYLQSSRAFRHRRIELVHEIATNCHAELVSASVLIDSKSSSE